MSEKKICPIFHLRSDYNGACKEENCMFWTSRYGCVVLEFMKQVISTESARP